MVARFTLVVFVFAIVRAMELITILNRCHRFRGFVYQHAHFSADKKSIEVAVRPRKGSYPNWPSIIHLASCLSPGIDPQILLTNL